MSQVSTSHELEAQSQALLQGPLKHARTAALALALVPLAAVAASTAAQGATGCLQSAGVCGTVFYDTNGNGIQDAGETGIEGASVTVSYTEGGTVVSTTVATDSSGNYDVGTVPFGAQTTVSVQIPPGTTASPTNVGFDDTVDSDGASDGLGNSVTPPFTADAPGGNSDTDFGFTQSGFSNPGTGTPGFWKNHPEAWPVSSITVGGVPYTRDAAIAILGTPVTKDKTYTMFASLVSAMLNVQVGNDSTCVSEAIAAGNLWMATYGPAGHGVAASSYAWKVGEPIHRLMDNYNNGMLCAPHRD